MAVEICRMPSCEKFANETGLCDTCQERYIEGNLPEAGEVLKKIAAEGGAAAGDGKCLAPGCDRPIRERGLCGACIMYWRTHSDDTTKTERFQAIAGVILPPRVKRRPGPRKKKPGAKPRKKTPKPEAEERKNPLEVAGEKMADEVFNLELEDLREQVVVMKKLIARLVMDKYDEKDVEFALADLALENMNLRGNLEQSDN